MRKTHIYMFITLLLNSAQSFSASIGDIAPDFSLRSIHSDENKARISVNNFIGKVVYVDFWASWCGPCLKSLPILNELHDKYKEKGFEVVAINLDQDINDALNFIKKRPVSYSVLYDKNGVTPEIYKIQGMPTAYIIDQTGVITYIHTGFKTEDKEKIEKIILKLL